MRALKWWSKRGHFEANSKSENIQFPGEGYCVSFPRHFKKMKGGRRFLSVDLLLLQHDPRLTTPPRFHFHHIVYAALFFSNFLSLSPNYRSRSSYTQGGCIQVTVLYTYMWTLPSDSIRQEGEDIVLLSFCFKSHCHQEYSPSGIFGWQRSLSYSSRSPLTCNGFLRVRACCLHRPSTCICRAHADLYIWRPATLMKQHTKLHFSKFKSPKGQITKTHATKD